DLAQDAGGVQPREPCEVDGGLGVAGALEHAAFARLEGEDVAGAGEVLGTGGGVDECLDRGGTIERGDTGARAVAVVDRHEEGGALALRVLPPHRVQLELTGALRGDRRADVARRVVEEERDLLGRDELRRHDEIAFVLAVLVVDDHDDLTATDGGHRVFDRCEPHHDSFHASRRSTYFAVTSTSRLTRSPASLWPRVVTSAVCGMTATVKPSSSTSTTVRLTPSTVIEPFVTT